MGRGGDDRSAQQRGQQPPHGPYGQQQNYRQQPPPPYGRQQQPYGRSDWTHGGNDEPEYFGGPAQGPGHGQPGYGHEPGPGGRASYGDPRNAYTSSDDPGHTQAFSIGEAPDHGYSGSSYGDDYADGGTYTAGQPAAPPAGPRLHWKQLLSGIVLRPSATFWQMRDHAVWGSAITITFLYGLIAVFGLDEGREDALNATLASTIPLVITTGIAVVIAGLIMGAVTHTLARQFGGDGLWAPTVGLSMLIMSITDTPRLLFALFMGGDAGFVQALGWLTWMAAGALFTMMVSRSHDLPWPRALGASSIQLLALLFLMKLGTF